MQLSYRLIEESDAYRLDQSAMTAWLADAWREVMHKTIADTGFSYGIPIEVIEVHNVRPGRFGSVRPRRRRASEPSRAGERKAGDE